MGFRTRVVQKHTRLWSPSTQLCDLVQSFRSPSFDLGLALLPPNASLSLSCRLFTCVRHIRQPSKLILLGLCECRARATALVVAEPSPSTTWQASVNLLYCWQDAGWRFLFLGIFAPELATQFWGQSVAKTICGMTSSFPYERAIGGGLLETLTLSSCRFTFSE